MVQTNKKDILMWDKSANENSWFNKVKIKTHQTMSWKLLNFKYNTQYDVHLDVTNYIQENQAFKTRRVGG